MCNAAEKNTLLLFDEGTEEQIADFLLEGNKSMKEVADLVKKRGIALATRVLRRILKKAGKSGSEERWAIIEKLKLAISLQFTQKIDNLTAEQLGEFSNFTPNLFGILDGQEQETSP